MASILAFPGVRGLRAVTIIHMSFLTVSISAANLYLETGRPPAGRIWERSCPPQQRLEVDLDGRMDRHGKQIGRSD